MTSLEDMRRELRERFEKLKESDPPSGQNLESYLIENIEDFAEQLVEMPEVSRKLEREIALVERILKKGFSGTEKGNPCSGELTPEEIEVCTDILKKLRETEQIYIVDLDYPVSITEGLFKRLDAMRRVRAEKIGIPEEQFDIESYFAFILGFLVASIDREDGAPWVN